MLHKRSVFSLGAVVLASLIGSGSAAEQYVRQRNREPLFYFAVMGEVARPGVYSFGTADPPLTELVRQAGGMTENATGNVRVIRRGRAGQQVFLKGGSAYSLLPGDVVVLTARAGAGQRETITAAQHFSQVDETNAPDGAAPTSVVQIALVNLLSHPVIIPIQSENATLARIISLLGQEAEIQNTVEVITAGAPLVHPARTAPPDAPLPSGTVLVFNPRAIDYNCLSELPPPVEAAQPVHAPAVPPYDEDAPGLLPSVAVALDVTPSEATIIPQVESVRPAPVESHSEPVVALTEEGPGEFSARVEAGKPLVEAPESRGVAAAIAFSCVFCGALAGSFFAFRSVHRRRTQVRRGAPSHDIEALIAGRLPLVEEPCTLDSLQQFHGIPTGAAKLRVDAPQTLAGPHFPVESRLEPADADADELVELAMAPTEPRRAPSPMPAPKAGRRHTVHAGHDRSIPVSHGLLDRVLVTVQRTAH